LAPANASAQKFFIKDGDRVVMIGDSITEQHLYSNYVEMWTRSRFPSWKLTFRNVGIGGDTSPGGNGRFQRDVLAYKPTVMTVDFGMNDGGYADFNEPRFKNYMNGLQGMADKAKNAGIRVAWITPQPLERNEPGMQLVAYNLTLEKFAEGVKEIAKKNDGLFVDQFHPYLAVIEAVRVNDPKIRVTGGDPVHPGPPGQALMAASILKGMRFPRLVSKAMVSAADLSARGDNCTISDVESKDGGVRFNRLDAALPFYPAEAKSILKWTPLLQRMNNYGLQVSGLKEGNYDVRLDGKKIAEHSAKELAKGVNLADPALAAGPVAEQVQKVWKAVQEKNRYFHDQIFRGLVLAGANSPIFKDKDKSEIESTRQTLYAERMQRMPALDAAVREALTMRPHLVEIVPAKQ
jgi:lysophospholipase L1-like esterase